MKIFVAHCVWGKSYGQGIDRPPWAGGTVAEFKDNYLRQNEALLNLVADFTLEGDRRGKQAILRILINRVDPLSVFHVNIGSLFLEFPNSMTRRERTENQQVLINCGDQTLSIPGTSARSPINFQSRNGQTFVEVFSTVEAPDGWTVGPEGLQFMSGAVYLDYFGNSEPFIPGVPTGALPPPPPLSTFISLFPGHADPKHSKDVKV